jgi:hypothetical protein
MVLPEHSSKFMGKLDVFVYGLAGVSLVSSIVSASDPSWYLMLATKLRTLPASVDQSKLCVFAFGLACVFGQLEGNGL